MKSEHIEKQYPGTATSQEMNKQAEDVKDSEIVEEANELHNEGISSATRSQKKGASSNDGLMTMMSSEEVEVLLAGANPSFFEVVRSGNRNLLETMLEKNPNLAEIKLSYGMLPIHMAASFGHQQIVRHWYKSHGKKFRRLSEEEEVRLFFTAVKNNIFDVALEMLKNNEKLATSREEEQLTALHLLARKSPDSSPWVYGWRVYSLSRRLFEVLEGKERDEMLEIIATPSQVLFDATKSGNDAIIESILGSNSELLTTLDLNRQTLFHTAALYRRSAVLFYPLYEGILKDLVMQAIDDDGNNILHMAGMVSPDQRFALSRPDILMQQELSWFKAVENVVPIGFKSMRNKEGKTPKAVFYSTHREYMISANLATKDKANYGMLVATIIATIVFAASLTVPGHDVSPNASFLILQKQGWFIVFFVSNSVALFSSSASIIFFLTILTSSHTGDEFNSSLLLRLTSGVTALFVAITTMVVAFIAACFLIFSHHSTWVAYLVASLGFFTVALIVFLLYTLFRDLIHFLYWSRAYKRSLPSVN